MKSGLEVGGRYGVLTIERIVGDTYYEFLVGKNPDGETRQLVTRGPGKEKGATRIPIRLPHDLAWAFTSDPLSWGGNDIQGAVCTTFAGWLKNIYSGSRAREILEQLTVPMVKMPREGNLISGLEWNAPGGTGEIGESLEKIANREFDEEAGQVAIGTESPFPPAMHASGIYDETQQVSFALIVGKPTKLVEGAKGWFEVPLAVFRNWARQQNQIEKPSLWQTDKFVPVDGKVIMAMWWLTQTLGLHDNGT